MDERNQVIREFVKRQTLDKELAQSGIIIREPATMQSKRSAPLTDVCVASVKLTGSEISFG